MENELKPDLEEFERMFQTDNDVMARQWIENNHAKIRNWITRPAPQGQKEALDYEEVLSKALYRADELFDWEDIDDYKGLVKLSFKHILQERGYIKGE